MSHCTSCGAALAMGKRFCSACGTPVLTSVAQPAALSQPPAPSAPMAGSAPVGADSSGVASSGPVPSAPMAGSAPVGADSSGGGGTDSAVGWLQAIAVVLAAIGLYVPWYRLPRISFNAFELPAAVILSFETNFRTLELGTVILVAIGIAIASLVVPGLLHRATLVSGIGLVGIALLFVIQSSRSLAGTTQGLSDVLGLGPIAIGVAGVLLIIARFRAASTGVEGSSSALGKAAHPGVSSAVGPSTSPPR